ncbi:MAG: hypothetical protein ACM3VX_06760 [Bacteroidota bacterium]
METVQEETMSLATEFNSNAGGTHTDKQFLPDVGERGAGVGWERARRARWLL